MESGAGLSGLRDIVKVTGLFLGGERRGVGSGDGERMGGDLVIDAVLEGNSGDSGGEIIEEIGL